jgi:hypothetical protein
VGSGRSSQRLFAGRDQRLEVGGIRLRTLQKISKAKVGEVKVEVNDGFKVELTLN